MVHMTADDEAAGAMAEAHDQALRRAELRYALLVEHSHDIIGDYQIVGSRLHLNFAASHQSLGKFFQPCVRSPLDPVH